MFILFYENDETSFGSSQSCISLITITELQKNNISVMTSDRVPSGSTTHDSGIFNMTEVEPSFANNDDHLAIATGSICTRLLPPHRKLLRTLFLLFHKDTRNDVLSASAVRGHDP